MNDDKDNPNAGESTVWPFGETDFDIDKLHVAEILNKEREALERKVSIVYDHVTGGKLSYPNYQPDQVIAEADEHYENIYRTEWLEFDEADDLVNAAKECDFALASCLLDTANWRDLAKNARGRLFEALEAIWLLRNGNPPEPYANPVAVELGDRLSRIADLHAVGHLARCRTCGEEWPCVTFSEAMGDTLEKA